MQMKLDLARLQHQIVDVLITDLAKFFDVIAQDIHPIVGARVGLGGGGGRPPRHPYRGVLIHPAPGPLAVQHPDTTLGNPPRHDPRSPCGSNGGAPIPAVHGHSVPVLCGRALPLPGTHVGGRHDRPLGTGRFPPYTTGPAGSADVVPGYPAGGCPGPQDPARLHIRPATSAVAHAGSHGPPSGPHVGNQYPGPVAGGISRGPGNTALRGPPLHGDGHLPLGCAHSPPEPATGPGSALETAPPPAALPRRRHYGTHGQAPEQAAPPGQRVPPHGQSTCSQRCSHGQSV